MFDVKDQQANIVLWVAKTSNQKAALADSWWAP
jgi:hypothetical protein